MRVDVRDLCRAQLTVEVRAQQFAEMLGHGASTARNCDRPRWIRLRTVPTGTDSESAISSYESPTTSHSTMAARYSSGRACNACCTWSGSCSEALTTSAAGA